MIDLTFLQAFTKGDEAKMKRYIGMYLKMAPETIGQMKEHLHNQNWQQLAITAHSLKPQTDYMGISELKAVLIEIEEGVKQHRVEDMEALVKKAQQLHDQSVAELMKYSS